MSFLWDEILSLNGETNFIQNIPSEELNSFSSSQEITHVLWKQKIHYSVHQSPFSFNSFLRYTILSIPIPAAFFMLHLALLPWRMRKGSSETSENICHTIRGDIQEDNRGFLAIPKPRGLAQWWSSRFDSVGTKFESRPGNHLSQLRFQQISSARPEYRTSFL